MTDSEKAEMERYYMTKGRYTFRRAADAKAEAKPTSITTTATKETGKVKAANSTEPVEAKRIQHPAQLPETEQ